MLLHLWFFIPTLVISHKYSKFQNSSLRKQAVYFPHLLNLRKNTQDTLNYDVIISYENSTSVLNKFWKSTGLCPPDPHEESYKFFLSSDMKQNLFHIGSLPYKGITQVRMHWLLDLVKMSHPVRRSPNYGLQANTGRPVYFDYIILKYAIVEPNFKVRCNFTYLDKLVKMMWKNNLYIGFELMGNPSNYFTDLENATQVYLWRNLVKAVADHYIDIYSIDYVAQWNFETWNEPDHHDFDGLNFTIQGFLNYYDACSDGLKLSDKRLKFGGPGGSCRIPSKGHSPICWALLNHTIRGRNFFTGKIGTRIDFISFHKKGNASTFLILKEELETIEYIRNTTNMPSHVPFYNDEADPLKNWALSKQWRADATYGAMVVKIILSHIETYFRKNDSRTVNFGLLSNDNAFLSYFPYQFTQRTLLSRFQVNNTYPNYVEFVKKPVYTVFGLLSQLCHKILDTRVHQRSKPVKYVSEFGIFATDCSPGRNQTVIIMYNSADSIPSNMTFNVHLNLNLSGQRTKNAKWISLELNNIDTNPYLIWEKQGMPAYPTTLQFSSMKNSEGPLIRGPFSFKKLSPWMLNLLLPNPGVTLISICRNSSPLRRVKNVRFFQITKGSLQISWTDDHNRCVLSYNIEYSEFPNGPYRQLNKKYVVFPSYWYSCSENDDYGSIRGFYRISAVDYWNNHGPFSHPVKFGRR